MLTSLRNSEDRQVDTQGVWKSFWRFFGALPVVPLQFQLREAAVAQLLHRERPCCKSLMLCEQVPVVCGQIWKRSRKVDVPFAMGSGAELGILTGNQSNREVEID